MPPKKRKRRRRRLRGLVQPSGPVTDTATILGQAAREGEGTYPERVANREAAQLVELGKMYGVNTLQSREGFRQDLKRSILSTIAPPFTAEQHAARIRDQNRRRVEKVHAQAALQEEQRLAQIQQEEEAAARARLAEQEKMLSRFPKWLRDKRSREAVRAKLHKRGLVDDFGTPIKGAAEGRRLGRYEREYLRAFAVLQGAR